MLEELLDLVFGKDEVEETVELPALRAVHTAVTDKNVWEAGEASEPGTVDGSWTTTDARAEPGTVDALRRKMDARAEPGTADALRRKMGAQAEPGTADGLWTEPTEMNCRTTFEGVVRTVEVEDAWSEEETAAEGAAELLAQIPVSGSPKAPHTAETEESRLPAVGDPVDRLLEWVSGVLTRESGEGMGVEMGLKGAWTAPVEAFRQETAAERLYGQVNAAWLRENGPGEHSVVVSMSGETTGDGLSLREVDRAFQRDARRYDGGLNLL